MNNCLLISFDLIRPGENPKSLAIASLMAFAKNHPGYGDRFSIEHCPVNMLGNPELSVNVIFQQINRSHSPSKYKFIAISCYVWSEYITNELIGMLKENGFQGKIVLGGYQIAYSSKDKLCMEYPQADLFITGYGEASLTNLLANGHGEQIFLNDSVDFMELPSVYLTNEIELAMNQGMVRMESKRGCPYRCSFCAHRDLVKNKVHISDTEKVFAELALFKERNVQKINILDPVFNMGKGHLEIMEEMRRIGLNALVCAQSRFEQIKDNDMGNTYLELASKLNFVMEFGLQTIVEKEYAAIERPNNIEQVKKVMHKLHERNIQYEVSLIYGLPNQTLDSFRQSIDFLHQNGCTNITAFPLMLLKGTELFATKSQWGMEEEAIGEYHIPVVTRSNSFSTKDWYQMKVIADGLMGNNGRVL